LGLGPLQHENNIKRQLWQPDISKYTPICQSVECQTQTVLTEQEMYEQHSSTNPSTKNNDHQKLLAMMLI